MIYGGQKKIEVPDKQASAGKAKRERDASLFMVASIYIANELVGCCGFASLSYRGCLTNISGQVPKIYSLSFHFNFTTHFYKSYERESAKGKFIKVGTLYDSEVRYYGLLAGSPCGLLDLVCISVLEAVTGRNTTAGLK